MQDESPAKFHGSNVRGKDTTAAPKMQANLPRRCKEIEACPSEMVSAAVSGLGV
jgi:hypothetical protein